MPVTVPLSPLAADVAPLTLSLFGPAQVWVDGTAVPPIHSRKALWLLALLSLRQGREVERAWLAGTFWPEIEESQAYANLRPVASQLRKILGDQAHRLQSPSRHTLRLDLTDVDVDVLAFDAALRDGSLTELARAVSLYRGPLLEGCAEEWIETERNARAQECLRALMTLAEASRDTGDDRAAAGYYKKLISLDPWQEAAQRGLMEALARNGDRNGALAVYRAYAALLRSDSRAIPDPETCALYDRLRAQSAPVSVQRSSRLAVHGSLPHVPTDLIGREDETSDVVAALRRSRLVVLVGPGGIGKTRLALEVASEASADYTDGVWLVSLETAADGEGMVSRIATALDLKEEPGQPMLETVVGHLRQKRLLLVLDNCEQLREPCAQIAAHLLREGADLRILATSREALGIIGETVRVVPALSVPDPEHLPIGRSVTALSAYESVQLFVTRAQECRATFALTEENARSVARVCARLEGIPLALELAAARVRVLTMAQIEARLKEHLGLLVSDSNAAQSRQQTLRATLDWSYSLLSAREQSMLGRLSIFVGGWTLDAAETVCSGEGIETGQVLDLLAGLADKSLVVFEERGETGRYRVLEMVRQYGADRLAMSSDTDLIKTNHREWYLALVNEAGQHLKGAEQGAWSRRLQADLDNIRAALDSFLADPQCPDAGLAMASSLTEFWLMRDFFQEGLRYLGQVLAHPNCQGATLLRAQTLNNAGIMTRDHCDYAGASRMYEESLSICRELGDKRGIIRLLGNLGMLHQSQNDYALSLARLDESLNLCRDLDEPWLVAALLCALGNTHIYLADYGSARPFCTESLALFRTLGDQRHIARALGNLANIEMAEGDEVTGRMLYEESLVIFEELEDGEGSAWCFSVLGDIASHQGEYGSAREMIAKSLRIRVQIGAPKEIGLSLLLMALLDQLQGDVRQAMRLRGAVDALYEGLGTTQPPSAQDDYDRWVEEARAALGDADFATVWNAGRALTWEQAVAEALGEEVCIA